MAKIKLDLVPAVQSFYFYQLSTSEENANNGDRYYFITDYEISYKKTGVVVQRAMTLDLGRLLLELLFSSFIEI